jgi:ubiquitin C-terminal hydrolase
MRDLGNAYSIAAIAAAIEFDLHVFAACLHMNDTEGAELVRHIAELSPNFEKMFQQLQPIRASSMEVDEYLNGFNDFSQE